MRMSRPTRVIAAPTAPSKRAYPQIHQRVVWLTAGREPGVAVVAHCIFGVSRKPADCDAGIDHEQNSSAGSATQLDVRAFVALGGS
jgi:hypothetical protein